MKRVTLANGMKVLAPESSDLRSGKANAATVTITGQVIAASEKRRWIKTVEDGRTAVRRMNAGRS
jgi:hypothetical protein